MFEFLRNLTKSEEERHQEMLTAYLDGALTPRERESFERQLAGDAELRAELERQQRIKASLRQLPRLRAPFNFTLDSARYGRQVSRSAVNWYPLLRTATVAAAVFLMVVVSADFLSNVGGPTGTISTAPSQPVETEAMAVEEAAEGEARELESAEAVEVTAAAELAAPAADSALPSATAEAAGESAVAEPSESEPAAELAEATSEPLASLAPAEVDVTEEAAVMEAPAEEAMPPETTPSPSEAAAVSTTSPPAATSQAFVEGQRTQEQGAAPPATTETVQQAEPVGPTPLRLAEIVLGFLVVLLVAATLLVRRRV